MLKLTSIVGYTSCGPTYIESFFTIFVQCINVLNYKYRYIYMLPLPTEDESTLDNVLPMELFRGKSE